MDEKNVTIGAEVTQGLTKELNDSINELNQSLSDISNEILITLYTKFPFLGYAIFGITYAQIIIAIFLFLFILIFRPILVRRLINLLSRVAKTTQTQYDDLIFKKLEKPLKFSFLILAFYIFVSILYLNNETINLILASFIIYNFYWILWIIVDSFEILIHKAVFKFQEELSIELGKFFVRVIKAILIIVGIASILSLWGVNVTALIASLGIGGLAFALAAKDTASNLFGSIAILFDKSIKIGDWIVVDGVEGVVEDVGMRTTKIRTFKRSLISIPNSIVANSHIENFSRRGVRRIKLHIGLIYDTSPTQLQRIVNDIKKALFEHEGIDKSETLLVNLDRFSDSSKDILVYTFTNTSNWGDYLKIKEEILYKIEEIVKRNGSDFAYPTESIIIERVSKYQ